MRALCAKVQFSYPDLPAEQHAGGVLQSAVGWGNAYRPIPSDRPRPRSRAACGPSPSVR